MDETTGVSGFHSPTSQKTNYVWPPQQGATGYEVARSIRPEFSLGCGSVTTSAAHWTDPEVPASGQVFYYLVRPVSPFVGTWGARSSGVDRGPICTSRFKESSASSILNDPISSAPSTRPLSEASRLRVAWLRCSMGPAESRGLGPKLDFTYGQWPRSLAGRHAGAPAGISTPVESRPKLPSVEADTGATR